MGCGASVPVHPHPASNVLVDLDVALRKDQSVEDNRKETVAVLRRLRKLRNVGDRDLLDTCILLQEAKEKKGKAAQEPGTPSTRLTLADIDHQIRIYNTERLCVVIDHRIRGLYRDNSWITELKSGKLRNVEMNSNGLYFVDEYLEEFRKRRSEKENKEDTTDPTNIFSQRLNRQEIQDSVDLVNRHQSVVRVMMSETPQQLMASMKIKYVDVTQDVKGKKEQTFVSYHKLLKKSKEAGREKDLYMRVARNDNVTGEDIEECLKEIRRITTHHDAIVRINQVISRQNSKGLMAALQDPRSELELPSPSDEIAEIERKYQILLHDAYTDTARQETDVRMEKDDIQKVIRSLEILKEIDTLEDKQTKKLLENLRKDEMDISEYIVDHMDESEERCYATLIFEKRGNKRVGTAFEDSCKFLTRREVRDIVKEFKAVWDIQRGDLYKLEKRWDRVLQEANVLPNDSARREEADFEKLHGYRKLFEEVIEHKVSRKNKENASPGFENLLKRQDVQRIIFKLYPAIIRINEVIEEYIKAKERKKEKKVIDDLEKKCLRAITDPSAKLVTGLVVNTEQKGYLAMLSGKIDGTTPCPEDPEDKCFNKRLTWKQIQEVISDWKVFEGFVEKVVSRRVNDIQCLNYYKEKLEDMTGTIKYYRYRRKEEEGEVSKEYTDKNEGEDFEELWGHTVLHLAVCANKTETATAILKDAPDLINTDIGTWPDNKDTYKGLTPFLIAVAQGNFVLVKLMLGMVSKDACDREWIGKMMKGTVFMAQLPFHTAVLCYMNDPNKDDTYREPENRFVKTIELLSEEEDVFKKTNYLGDTVLHSIMRFVKCFPACEERTVDMMPYLESLMKQKAEGAKEDVLDYKRKIFFRQNENHMTALQLAAESGHIKLFAYLFKVNGVYLMEHPHDELYEIRRFDVTEMDKIALIEAQGSLPPKSKPGTDDKKGSSVEANGKQKPSPPNSTESNGVKPEKGTEQPKVDDGPFHSNSVAEILCCQRLPVATELVRGDVFEEMVRRKMDAYRPLLLFLCIFHVSSICILCVYVVARAGVTEGIYWPSGFLEFCNIYTFVCSILYFVQEFPFRFCFTKQPFALTAMHHNVVYRVTFVLFAIFLFADSILYRIPNSVFVNYKSTCLVLAIIVGTWPILFFLRMCRRFSVYIVLLNEALFTAVVPFAGLILMQMLVFTACMHASFLHSEANTTVVDDFSQYGVSFLTMGKLMVGLTEIEQLLKSREDGIVLFLFALFILITFLLMINALIGIMTNRFHDTQTNNEMVWRLQNLSVIIFIEGWYSKWTSNLPNCFPRLGVDHKESIGENTDKDNQSPTGDFTRKRFVMSYRKVRSNTADNPTNAEHILRQQVKKSDELNAKVDRLLDFQESKSYDGTRALQIYHYRC
ncbi:uncharacterized protein [Haliotis asinina]|uniref:uncharacterized protein n=1 Tax=Haliotis asinina TaxID=109174 RepID=UPI0035323088